MNKEGRPKEKSKAAEIYLEGIEDEGECGWFSCRPAFLQLVNNPTGYLCVLSMFLVTQGPFVFLTLFKLIWSLVGHPVPQVHAYRNSDDIAQILGLHGLLVNGYTNVVLSTLERRFRLQSFETGVIVVSYDIGYFILCLFVTYYGNKGHRPRMLAISSMVLGLGCLIFSIPHFTTDVYAYGENYSDLCDESGKPPACDASSSEEDQLDNYFYLFMFAMMLQGFGSISLFTVGYTALEDSLSKDKAALYLGIANSMTILGPCLGYAIGGVVLTVYVDFDTLEPDEIELVSSDPRWVGAWWIGYLVAAGMAWLLVALPMSGFPKQFPGSALVRSMKDSEVHVGASEDIVEEEGFGDSIKDLPRAACLMVRNAPFLCTTFAGCSEAFIVAAFTAFLPKYIQTQFSLTSAEAGLYTGIIAVPGGIVGMLISPVIINRLKLRTPGILKMCLLCCVTVLSSCAVCLFRCPTTAVAGATVQYADSSPIGNLSTVCNSECGCQGEYFAPVCGSDNLTYFSSCYAGCQRESEDGSFVDCSCIADGKSIARSGLCEESCDALIPFLCLFFFIVMINFMTSTPVILITIRCVPPSQKTFAMGVQYWIMRPLGAIPGPIVFGLIFDATCKLWQEAECSGEQGSCWIHDSAEVSLYVFIASLLCKAFSAVLFSLALYTYKPVGSGDEFAKSADMEFDGAFEGKRPSVSYNNDGLKLPTEDATTKL